MNIFISLAGDVRFARVGFSKNLYNHWHVYYTTHSRGYILVHKASTLVQLKCMHCPFALQKGI